MRLTVRNVKEQAHEDGAWTSCWVAGTNTLITGAVDETVKVWTSADDGFHHQHTYSGFAGHTLGVISVASDATGTLAASSALDSFVRVWSTEDHQERVMLESLPTEVWSIAFGPQKDRTLLAAAGGTNGTIKLWDITSHGASTVPPSPTVIEVPQAADGNAKSKEKFVLSVAFSPDGRSIACGSMDGLICIFDLETQALKHKLTGHFKPVRSIAFTPDSQLLLSACDDMQVHLYESTGNLIEAFSGHESWVLSVAAHNDNTHFATGSSDGKVKLWDIPQRACVTTSTEHKDQVWSVAFNQDGNQLASCGDDGMVATYNIQ